MYRPVDICQPRSVSLTVWSPARRAYTRAMAISAGRNQPARERGCISMKCNSVKERWTRQRARREPLREGYRVALRAERQGQYSPDCLDNNFRIDLRAADFAFVKNDGDLSD